MDKERGKLWLCRDVDAELSKTGERVTGHVAGQSLLFSYQISVSVFITSVSANGQKLYALSVAS